MILEPDQVVRDTYTVERLLGEGAFAEVYRVRHRFMGRQAMKVFKRANASLKDIEKDLTEAILLSRLKHPHVVEVFDANLIERGGSRYGYFTMTHVAGGTLDRYWRSFGADLMPVEQAVDIVRQACHGLSTAHASKPPIVHRDIKPQNILVGFEAEGLRVRLSDFGLAKSVNPLTMLLSARGTLGFKPPESLDNIDSCSSDIWALGTTLYLLLSDQMPFPQLDDRDAGDANRFLRPIRPPSLYNARVDPSLESIVYRCLAASPADRYPHAAALLEDLTRWKPGFAERARSVSQRSESGKSTFSAQSPHDLRAEAQSALKEALGLARDPLHLSAAADLLEEAISKDPTLHERYEPQLRQLRKGVMPVSTAALPRVPRPGADRSPDPSSPRNAGPPGL